MSDSHPTESKISTKFEEHYQFFTLDEARRYKVSTGERQVLWVQSATHATNDGFSFQPIPIRFPTLALQGRVAICHLP
jgi:hypothetical protein